VHEKSCPREGEKERNRGGSRGFFYPAGAMPEKGKRIRLASRLAKGLKDVSGERERGGPETGLEREKERGLILTKRHMSLPEAKVSVNRSWVEERKQGKGTQTQERGRNPED